MHFYFTFVCGAIIILQSFEGYIILFLFSNKIFSCAKCVYNSIKMNALYSFFSAFHGTEIKTTNKSKICFPFFILYDEEILNDLKCLNFNARYLRILNQNLWKSAFRGCALSSMTSIRKKPECIRVRSNSKQRRVLADVAR